MNTHLSNNNPEINNAWWLLLVIICLALFTRCTIPISDQEKIAMQEQTIEAATNEYKQLWMHAMTNGFALARHGIDSIKPTIAERRMISKCQFENAIRVKVSE